jgi:hypothetical protein
MKKQKSPLNPDSLDPALEVELARRRSLHHVHDASRILTDAMPFVEADNRQLYTAIVGGLSTLECHLADLKPKA